MTQKTRISTRREFLAQGLGLVGVGSALPNFLINTAMAGPAAKKDEKIVVALALIGGHDGLSTVPPYGIEDYYRIRKATRIGENEVIKLNKQVGLHPKLAGFKGLLDNQAFAVVLGTGYPSYNLSHFIARDYWEAARSGFESGKAGSTGWLGRYIDYVFKDNKDPKLSLSVGPYRTPLIITGADHPGIGFSTPDSFRFTGERSEPGQKAYRNLNATASCASCSELQFITQTAVHANTSSQAILDLVSDYEPDVEYPDTEFGSYVKTIAGMINRGLSTRVYYAAQGTAIFGGYDTHAEQRPRHDRLMDELCQTVTAFYKDLAKHGNADRVLTFTFSEFGRRVAENYSGGTDHGLAQPMFLFGRAVKPGVHGTQSSLTDLDENGNLKTLLDFRRVYAAILEKWLGVPHEPILGAKFELLDCMAG